jgi:nicotinamidase/pyrazinamidase
MVAQPSWRRPEPHYDGAMSSLPTPQRPRYDTWTALVVVDVQNDFADPRGSLAVAGATSMLPALEGEIAAARAAGSLVVYTQDWHPADTPHFAKDGGIWPVHCVHETWGADFHPRLTRDGPVVRKGTNGEDGYSGFSMRDPVSGETTPTELVDLLRQRSIERVVVVGLATDYCVRATALDAHALGFGTIVVRDAVAAVDMAPGDGAKALADLAAVGVQLV